MSRHLWVRFPRTIDPAELPGLLADGLPAPLPGAVVAPLDACRRLRGPFTATGQLVRALAPGASAALVERHQVELLSTAPELRAAVDLPRETLTSLAVPAERTRFYSGVRTQRLGHGVVEFVHARLRELGGGPRSLVVRVVDADHTDLEFLAALVRRTDPALLTVVVCDSGEDPGGPLTGVLREHADEIPVPAPPPAPSGLDDLAAATRYVDGDCAVDLPELVAAYHRLPEHVRAELHDRRADALTAGGEPTHALGAVPLHRERGTDPRGAGLKALDEAINHCVDMGFYHATVDFGLRGRALLDPAESFGQWWVFSTKMTTSLLMLRRAEEAEAIYDELIALTDLPRAHMQAAYARAMIHTRHRERRDHLRAKGLIKQAIAFSRLLADEGDNQVFSTVFHQNGLALVEMHLGDLEEALRLVTEGAAWLDRTIEPGTHALHRSVLVHNRAQLLAKLGRTDEALECFDQVIAADPNHPDHYIDRGNLLHTLGRDAEALADYDTAIRLGPPFPEAQYNRAELLLDLDEVDAALAVLDHVLDLDPDMVDARVNRAGIHLDRGDLTRARADAEHGLAIDPDNAHLHLVVAQVLAEEDAHAAATAAFDRALAADPDLLGALVGRAASAHELGDNPAALADLDRAVALAPDDPAVRFNRALLHEAAARWDNALADLVVAAESAPDDEDVTSALDRCRTAVCR
ncbi:tetratricopeptide repeat protein [Actinokineospora spheciospongiae]|uniref:tetratricopeptide repeat protein n=1 Tax=Actinokineospora spheciospongiae TaxID=909613 RepID=UPI000D70A706|nr:tetratricopeptide repeat protein [Actinokineospora spheciospongiae]PWW66891.1 tetratricopeptide repeat protein [Actinokineospora spheciospongiae]